jgi:hypothetical protein
MILFSQQRRAEKEGIMPDTREQIQRDAYGRGQQMKQWHLEQQRVVSHEALAILAADFAQVSLFKANHHLTGAMAHERAGLCERAFQEGYCAPCRTLTAPPQNGDVSRVRKERGRVWNHLQKPTKGRA